MDTLESQPRHTHRNAPTQYVDAAGTRLAFRRFGKQGSIPLLFFQHFAGNIDNWDPAITDGLAQDREVILFNNAGVSSSGGDVSTSIEDMAKHAANLIVSLNIRPVDLFGFSTGSLVAQQLTIDRPDLVRRVILVGSTPRGGVGMSTLTPEFREYLTRPRERAEELLLDVFFTASPASVAAGREFLARLRERTVDRDVDIDDQVVPAQTLALAAWGAATANSNAYLKAIEKPVFLASGSADVIFYTVNAFTLQQNLPNAQLILYPDSGHGPHYQYPKLFLEHVSLFLNVQNY